METRRVILCADDFGLAEGVSRGILELLGMGRLSATSCMVVFPEFEEHAMPLKAFFDKADIGLHFTLTADRGVGELMRDAYLGRLDERRIASELERQLAKFVSVMGRYPDYIDGHQHVHLLPGVRGPVTRTAAHIGAYVRSTLEPVGIAMSRRPSPVEAAFLSLTASPLQRLIGESNIATNRGFRGVRTFRERSPYRSLFRRMIEGAGRACLIMCHPGFGDAVLATRDPVIDQREEELRYLASEEFPLDMASAGLELSGLSDALSRVPVAS